MQMKNGTHCYPLSDRTIFQAAAAGKLEGKVGIPLFKPDGRASLGLGRPETVANPELMGLAKALPVPRMLVSATGDAIAVWSAVASAALPVPRMFVSATGVATAVWSKVGLAAPEEKAALWSKVMLRAAFWDATSSPVWGRTAGIPPLG